MSVLRPHAGLLAALQRGLDALLIGLVFFVLSIELNHEWTPMRMAAAGVAIGLFLLAGEARRLYASWRLQSLDEEFGSVMVVWGITCAALIVIAFLFKVSGSYSRIATVAWFLCTPAFLLGSRLAIRVALRAARKSGRNSRSVAIAGMSPLAEQIIGNLRQHATFGLKIVGIFDDRSLGRLAFDGGDPSVCAGSLDDLMERARQGEIDYVFIALPLRAEKRISDLVNRLADTTASVYVIPDLFIFDLMRARMTMLGGMPAVSVYESPFDGLNGYLKRLEDLVLGGIFLAVAAAPMLVIALAVKMTTRGPVFFKQRRYGLNGRVVNVLKFRTMTTADDGDKVMQATAGDARVTPIGRFLRRSSLDELPQLLNVITGEMSLVGPRPHAVAHNEEYRGLIHGYMLRHKVKPGITGWAQVNGWRGETDTLEKMQGRVQHDLEYVQNWSLWLDVKILWRTVHAVFARTNAV